MSRDTKHLKNFTYLFKQYIFISVSLLPDIRYPALSTGNGFHDAGATRRCHALVQKYPDPRVSMNVETRVRPYIQPGLISSLV